MLDEGITRAHLRGEAFQEMAIVAETIEEVAKLLDVCGIGHVSESPNLFVIKIHASWGNGVAEEVGVGNTGPTFARRKLEVAPAEAQEECHLLATWEMGSASKQITLS